MAVCQLHHLAFTLPQGLTVADLPALVADWFGVPDLDPLDVRQTKGRNGHNECYSLRSPDGAELIAILLDGAGSLRGTSRIEVHGRAWETSEIDAVYVCQQIIARQGWGTEIHLAADDTDSLLPWDTIQAVSLSPNWEQDITTTLCRQRISRRTGESEGAPTMTTSHTGASVYYGVRASDTSVCIYDRRGPLRVEYRTRTRAGSTDIIRRIAEGEEIGTITAGVLARVLRFHEPGGRRKDRRPVCAWWSDFLGAVEPIKLPRQRDARHKSPWYVPPTRAQRVTRYISKQLRGDDTDAPVMDAIRGMVADANARQQVAEEWNRSETGIRPCNYQSQFSSDLDKLLESLTSGVSVSDLSQDSMHLPQFSTQMFNPRSIDIDNIQFG